MSNHYGSREGKCQRCPLLSSSRPNVVTSECQALQSLGQVPSSRARVSYFSCSPVATLAITSILAMSSFSSVTPRNTLNILSGCHLSSSDLIILYRAFDVNSAEGPFSKKSLTEDSFTSPRLPDLTGHGMLAADIF